MHHAMALFAVLWCYALRRLALLLAAVCHGIIYVMLRRIYIILYTSCYDEIILAVKTYLILLIK
jgi:hypothetical protein